MTKYLFMIVIMWMACEPSTVFCQVGNQGAAKHASKPNEAFLKSGIEKFRKKDYEGALVDFQQHIKENPKDKRGYRWSGDALEALNRHAEAIDEYSHALKLDDKDTLSYAGRGESKRMNYDYGGAIDDYNVALRLDSTRGNIYFARGVANFETHQYKASLVDISKAIRIFPKQPLFLYFRAAAYAAVGNYPAVKADIKQYFKIGGKKVSIYYYSGMANIYLATNVAMLDSAIHDLTLYTNSENPLEHNDQNAYQLLGFAYSKLGDSTNARINFEKSLKLKPNNVKVYMRWGSAEINFGNYKKADELLTKAYELYGKPDETSADFYLNFSMAKLGIQDTAAFVDLISKAIAAEGPQPNIYEMRLTVLLFNAKYNKIKLADADHLIQLTKDDNEMSQWYFAKAIIYFSSHQLDSSRNEINQAVKLSPNESTYYMLRASIHAEMNSPASQVLKDFNEAIALHPELPEAYLLKAHYYARQKQYKEGCAMLKLAVEKGANVPKEMREYICKGKVPANGKVPAVFVPLTPKFLNPLDELTPDGY